MSSFQESPSVSVEPQGFPELSFQPHLPAYVLFPLALLIVLSAVRSYARSTRPLSASRRLRLWLLRAASAMVVLLCLSQPVLVQAIGLRERGLCFIVLDASASMNFGDAEGGLTRWQQAGRLYAQHQDALSDLGSRFEVRRYLFDLQPRETANLPGERANEVSGPPKGEGTDLVAMLRGLSEAGRGSPCAGALLMSDGRHNAIGDPSAAARVLDRENIPLYVVGLGKEATPADFQEIQVKLLEAPERGFVHSQLLLRIEVESTLPKAITVPLTISVNDEQIDVKELKLSAGPGVVSRVDVPYTPATLGIQQVVAALPILPKEPNVNNNRRTAYLRVFQTKLGVWYVEGALRKEFGALRSALETAPNVNLLALNKFVRSGKAEPDLLPQTEDLWKELRLVIIGDLPRDRFERGQIARLAEFVEEGGAVLMIGGVENFGAGGWHQTRLAPVLPVEMDWADGAREGRFPITVTDIGLGHPATLLSEDPQRSLEIWKKLPPVPGLNGVSGIRPAAKGLLEAGGSPLLVVQDYGKGRSAVYTGEKTWQWALKAGQGDAHKRFWRNLVTWSTRSEYRDADQIVFVEAERMQYLVGEEVVLHARVQETDKPGKKVNGAAVLASLEKEGGAKKSWEMGRGAGAYSETLAPKEPGSYRFEVQVMGRGGAVFGADEVRFQMEALDLENENPKADLRLLQRLAAVSGGVYFDAEHVSEAFNQLLRRPAGYTKTVRETKPLWNPWAPFGLLVSLLTIEWTLRKRWGLV